MHVTLEHASDALGLLSGIALLVTAWRNDGLFGFNERLRQAVEQSKKLSATPDKMAGAIVAALDADATTWSWVDRWSLRSGAGLLLLSYALKLVHQGCDC
jgi:hypothetical protein